MTGRNVVCISRSAGAGGEDVGRLVAAELGFQYVDEEIVAQAAARAGIGSEQVADEERRRSLVLRVLDTLAAGSELPAVGGSGSHSAGDEYTSDDIRTFIRDAIVQTAGTGDVVIVAHAASFALGESASSLRVLITASLETRARRLAEEQGLDSKGAGRLVKDADAARQDYLKRFYGVDRELPTHYDLVVNTDALEVEEAARIVVQTVRPSSG